MRSILPRASVIDHLVIGGGVLGLSIANALRKSGTTFVIDSKRTTGTKLPRSAIIQSGIYYPLDSLSSRLCIRGRKLLYERCDRLKIPYKKTEKLIIATENLQVPHLDALQTLTTHPSLVDPTIPSSPYISSSTIPTYFLSPTEACALEANLSERLVGALLVRETGVVDYDQLLQGLRDELEGDADGGGVLIPDCDVLQVDRLEDERGGDGEGWTVQLKSSEGRVESVQARNVINTLGPTVVAPLSGPGGEEAPNRVKRWFLSYNGPGIEGLERIIHPSPPVSAESGEDHIAARLNISVNNRISFGPILSASPPTTETISKVASSIQMYLPGLDASHLEMLPEIPETDEEVYDTSDVVIRSHPGGKGGVYLDVSGGGVTSALALGEEVGRIIGFGKLPPYSGVNGDDDGLKSGGSVRGGEKKGGWGWLSKMSEGWDR